MAIFTRKGKKEMKLGEVDKILSELRIPTALVTTPTNLDKERERFFGSDTYNPNFEYRIIKNNNHKIFTELSSLETIVDVDPRISKFYLKLIDSKKEANDLMHAVGDNVRFTKIASKRFKEPTPVLFRNASRVLRGLTKNYNVVKYEKSDRRLDYGEISKIAKDLFEEYGLEGWSVNKSINIAKNGMKVGIKRKELLVDKNISKNPMALKKGLVHEMVHVIRAHNGMNSGFNALMKPTLPYYLDSEEGLATWNVEKMDLMIYNNLRDRAGYVWAIYIGSELTFRELYNASLSFLPKYTAFKQVYRVKRGLGDTAMPGINPKDVVYFRGFRKIRRRFEEDPKFIEKLYAGKIGFSQVKWVDEGLIKKPKILPKREIYDKVFKKYDL